MKKYTIHIKHLNSIVAVVYECKSIKIDENNNLFLIDTWDDIIICFHYGVWIMFERNLP